MSKFDNEINILEIEFFIIAEKIDEDSATHEELSRHMLLREQIRELKYLKCQQEHDMYDEHDYDHR